MKKTVRMLKSLALVLALALCLCACAVEDEPEEFWEEEPEESAPEEAVPVEISAFALPILTGQTLDPITCPDGVQQTLSTLLYEGLFALDEQFTPLPRLCASYTVSEDGLVYTFTLREGVTFSDGSALTAADALASLRRAAASERYGARLANVIAFKVSGGALVVTLHRPDSALPALLDIPIVKAGTENSLVPAGTGPYFLITDSEGPCLSRNDNYWRAVKPPLPRIALVEAKSTDAVSYLFSSYDVHLLTTDLTGTAGTVSVSGSDITDAPTTEVLYLGFNAARPLTGDAALRRAMGRAIDRTSVAGAFLAGHATPAQFPISPSSPLYPAALEQDYDSSAYGEALRLPDAEGEQIPELTLLVNEENSFKVATAEYLCRQFSTKDLTVKARILPWAEYLSALQGGAFDLFLGQVRLQADWDCSPLVASYGALNYGSYGNETTDALLAAFLTNETAETAQALCAHLAQEAPILPLAFKSSSVLTPAGLVDDLTPTASNPFYGFEQWTLHLPEE